MINDKIHLSDNIKYIRRKLAGERRAVKRRRKINKILHGIRHKSI